MQNRGHQKPEDSSESDIELWRRFTSGVRPLQQPRPAPVPNHQPPPASPPPVLPERRAAPPAAAPPAPPKTTPPSPASLSPGSAAGLDQRTLVRLKRGLIRPETQIDLHRMTQEEAHGALIGFLGSAQRAGRRCVLVITGKGYGSDGAEGVLKSNVPRWINEFPNRERVLAFTFAAGRDGGEGALYVLLRRLRSDDPPAPGPARRR